MQIQNIIQPFYELDSNKPHRLDLLQDILKDRITCNHYIKAISECPFLFQNKTVLAIHSGCGFLSLLCCRAGARKVYNLDEDNDDNERLTRALLKQNGYQSRVKILRGYIQNIKMEKVDIIVSLCGNYTLFYENKLQNLIYARDHFLVKGGLMFPNIINFKVALIQDQYYYDKKISFWDSVYKVNMKCMKQWVLTEPIIDIVDPQVIITDTFQLFSINIQTIKYQELDFVYKYKLTAVQSTNAHALVAWFDLHFTLGPNQNILSTSPFTTKTQYKQSIFYLKNHLQLYQNDIISGTIAMKRSNQDKSINFKISYHHKQNSLIQYYVLT